MTKALASHFLGALVFLSVTLLGCSQYKAKEPSQDSSLSNSNGSPSPSTRPSPSASPGPTVSPSPSPNPSQPPSGAGPEPDSNDLIVFQDDFENGLSKWDEAPSRYTIETDPVRVHSGHSSVKCTYTTTSAYGALDKWFMPGYSEIYLRVSLMFSEGFKNLRSDGWGMHLLSLRGNRIDNKYSSTGQAGHRPSGTDFFSSDVDPEIIYQDPTLRPFMFYSYFPDMTCSSNGSCYGNSFYQTEPKTPTVSNRWIDVVFRLKANTPGQKDGAQELWIDGVKKISVNNMRWRDTTDVRVNMVRLVNFMEENGIGAPQTEYIWWDDLVVWSPVN